MLIIDGHLDLAMNALLNERDQTLPVTDIRANEKNLTGDDPGLCSNSLHEMREARTALCVTTVISRCKPVKPDRDNQRRCMDFPTQEMAYACAQAQLAYYRMLEQQGHVRIIDSLAALDDHWQTWQSDDTSILPIGLIITMEGADPIVEPEHVHQWFDQGLRSLMLAHFSQSCYAMGTLPIDGSESDGPVTAKGRALLNEMSKLPMALDLTHLCDQSFFEAIDLWDGPILASHSNCRALADAQRQLSDEQLQLIIKRDGVIGMAIYYPFLSFELDDRGECTVKPDDVPLDRVADHIDHVCQLAGSNRHVAIGSDLDGGYGANESTTGIDTSRDLHKLEPILSSRGYSDDDITGIMHGNWLRFYRDLLT